MEKSALLSIPNVDKRSPFEAPNLVGIILYRSDEGFYEIGTSGGRLDRKYISTQFDLCHSHTLSIIDIPSMTVILREAHFMFLLGSINSFVSALLAATQTGVGVGVVRKCVALDAMKSSPATIVLLSSA